MQRELADALHTFGKDRVCFGRRGRAFERTVVFRTEALAQLIAAATRHERVDRDDREHEHGGEDDECL